MPVERVASSLYTAFASAEVELQQARQGLTRYYNGGSRCSASALAPIFMQKARRNLVGFARRLEAPHIGNVFKSCSRNAERWHRRLMATQRRRAQNVETISSLALACTAACGLEMSLPPAGVSPLAERDGPCLLLAQYHARSRAWISRCSRKYRSTRTPPMDIACRIAASASPSFPLSSMTCARLFQASAKSGCRVTRAR